MTKKEINEIQVQVKTIAAITKGCDTITVLPQNPPGEPGQPKIEKMKDFMVKLNWAVPDSDGGLPITSYILEMQLLGHATWTVG